MSEDNKHIVYSNIKKTRKQRGMSQSKLAELVGYADKTMISHIENGKIDLSTSKLAEIARALNVSPAYLMGWTDNDDPDYPFNEDGIEQVNKTIIDLVGVNTIDDQYRFVAESLHSKKTDGIDAFTSKDYYIDVETAKIAQELHDNQDMRMLFDAAKDSKPEDLKMVADMLKRLKSTNPEG